MLTKEGIIRTLESEGGKIRSFGVRGIALFGSFATDSASTDSDIDLLVEFEKDRGGYDDYMGLLLFLQDLFGREIDLVKKEQVREELQDEILKGVQHAAKI